MTLVIGSIVATISALPVLVFVAETCVVTLATIRTIFIARGMKFLAAFLGFFEVSIWLFAIGQVMQHLTRPDCYLAFAAGFSLGNFLGVLIEKKLALGSVAVHITTRRNADDLIAGLRSAGYGTTALDARGATGSVQVVFTVIKRREVARVVSLIERFDAKAFYWVKDLQLAAEGVSPAAARPAHDPVPAPLQQMYRVMMTMGKSIAASRAAASGESPTKIPARGFRGVVVAALEREEATALRSEAG